MNKSTDKLTKRHEVTGNTKAVTSRKIARQRFWCFTEFQENDYEKIFSSEKIRYLLVGKEICPTTNKVHWQGYVQFYKPERLTAIKKLFNSKQIHLEICKGSVESNVRYCKKEKNFIEYGQVSFQGKRNDLVDIQEKLEAEVPMIDIAREHFGDFVRYHKGFEKYRELLQKEKSRDFRSVEVEVISGPTGQGKTRRALYENGDSVYKIEGDNLQWWDGYEGESTIVIDEYSNQINVTKLLNILDGHRLRLSIKGGFTYARWNKVIITTNLKKYEFHDKAKPEHRQALARRITTWTDLWPQENYPIFNH